MLKKLKSLFKQSPIVNNQGSVLSVALIIITVLTFSVSTITQLSVNLAGQTNRKIENVTDENIAKTLIDLSIDEFEVYVTETTEGDYDGYLNTLDAENKNNFGVLVTDITSEFHGGITPDDDTTKAFKFSYTLSNGNVLYKNAYASEYVILPEVNLNPFDYQIGTNGDVILNGGYYDFVKKTQTTDAKGAYIFGDHVYVSRVSPYEYPVGSTNQYLTPQQDTNYPYFDTTPPAVIYDNYGYLYCAANCFDTNNLGNPFVINESFYNTVDETAPFPSGEMQTTNILNFFGDFDFEQFIVDFINNKAPRRDEVISANWNTLEADILSESDPISVEEKTNKQGKVTKVTITWPETPFVNITSYHDDPNYEVDFTDFKQGNDYYSMVYEGDLTIDGTISMPVTKNNGTPEVKESLIVTGDLTLNSPGQVNLDGAIFVFGDLYLQGATKDIEGSIFVLGETFIDFDLDQGIRTSGNNAGFTLLTQQNIYFESHRESHDSDTQAPEISAVIYTQESIYIDAVNNRLNMTGSLFSRTAQAYTPSKTFMQHEDNSTFNGIVVNSYYGWVSGGGTAIPGSGDTSHRFRIGAIASTTYQDRFANIPVFNSIIQEFVGIPTVTVDDFKYE